MARRFFNPKTIPTLIGVFLLIMGIAGGVYLVQTRPSWLLRAAPGASPKQIKITNVSDTSLTVSWITETAVTGFAKYGTATNLQSVVLDDRDQASGETKTYTTHYVTLRNLNPQTSYYFKIGSGKSLFDNNGQPYQITTAPKIITPPPASDPAYGIILKADNSPAEGVIVYLSLANAAPLSTLTKNTGSWMITLNNARAINLSSYLTYDQETSTEEILVQGGAAGTATAVATTKNDSPMPTITLGESYDFRQAQVKESVVVEEETTPPEDSKFSLEPVTTPPGTPADTEELTITNPTEEEEVSTQRPEFFGTGPAGIEIEITIQSPTSYSATVTIDANGNWQWTPPKDLEPGKHTITAKYTDENGLKHLISHSFVILAAGDETPSFEATPSGKASPSPTATPSPTISPTATPSTRAGIPSTEGGIPESGNLTPTFFLFIMGIGLIGFGLISHTLFKKKVF